MARRKKPLLLQTAELQADGSARSKTVRADELRPRKKPFHKMLTDAQTMRASALWSRIGVYVGSKRNEQEWIDMFRYEGDPDYEMGAWEHIAGAFEDVGGPELPENQQTIVLNALLLISMGVVDVESQTGLSEEVANELRAAYDHYAVRVTDSGTSHNVFSSHGTCRML